jgi:hypothetical protein
MGNKDLHLDLFHLMASNQHNGDAIQDKLQEKDANQ